MSSDKKSDLKSDENSGSGSKFVKFFLPSHGGRRYRTVRGGEGACVKSLATTHRRRQQGPPKSSRNMNASLSLSLSTYWARGVYFCKR